LAADGLVRNFQLKFLTNTDHIQTFWPVMAMVKIFRGQRPSANFWQMTALLEILGPQRPYLKFLGGDCHDQKICVGDGHGQLYF
jgi:hypothetical protein